MPEALFVSGGPYESRTRDKRIHDALLPGFDTLPTGVFASNRPRLRSGLSMAETVPIRHCEERQ